jgi:hypothetical protein
VGDPRPRVMAVTQRATAVHRIRLIGELHTFFRPQKTRRSGFLLSLRRMSRGMRV